MLSIINTTNILLKIAERAKLVRLGTRLTQKGLASRSGVSLGSIKRFESKGLISMESLVKIALVLDCLEDFNCLFKEKQTYQSLDEALNKKHQPKRGIIK